MKRYVLTPRAKRDLDEIWDYIADDNIEAADRILNALESAIIALTKNPGVGHHAGRDVENILKLSPDEP